MNIISISKARGKLGNLARTAVGEDYVVLTRGGEPRVALVDVRYLTKLEDEVKKIYQKTFIDPNLLPVTREFSDEEIREWGKEDQL